MIRRDTKENVPAVDWFEWWWEQWKKKIEESRRK